MKLTEIQDKFQEAAFAADRKYFGLSTAVSSVFHQSRTAKDYNFAGSTFKWRQVASHGTGNGGYFVAVAGKTKEGRKAIKARNMALKINAPGWNIEAMMKAPRFFELLPALDELLILPLQYQKWFAGAETCSFKAISFNCLEDWLEMAGSVPRLQDLQSLIRLALS